MRDIIITVLIYYHRDGRSKNGAAFLAIVVVMMAMVMMAVVMVIMVMVTMVMTKLMVRRHMMMMPMMVMSMMVTNQMLTLIVNYVGLMGQLCSCTIVTMMNFLLTRKLRIT